MLKVPDCSIGVIKDIPPEEVPMGAWTDARNVRFGRGFAERRGGFYDQLTTPSVTPYGLFYYRTASANFWIHLGLASAFADDGTTKTDITGTAPTGTADDRWTGGTLSGVFVCNNGVDKPMYWDGNTANNLATLTGWDANWRAKSVRPWKELLVAINVTKSGTNYRRMVKTSVASVAGSVPASWDATDESNIALEFELPEGEDPLVDGLALGDQFICFGERSMWRFTFVGGQEAILRQKIETDMGMMARGCGAVTPAGIVFVSQGDVCLYNGQAPQSICDGTIREWLFNTLDTDNFERSFVTVNPTKSEVLFCFPSRGKTVCDMAAVWNWTERKWSIFTLPNVTAGANGLVDDPDTLDTWTSTSGTWETDSEPWYNESLSLNRVRLMVTTTGPSVSAFDYGDQDRGSDIDWYMERTGMMGNDGDIKLAKDVYPVIEAASGTAVDIELGSAMRPHSAPVYRTAVSFDVGTDYRACVMTKGRSLAVRFSGTGRFKMRSYSIGIQPAGR